MLSEKSATSDARQIVLVTIDDDPTSLDLICATLEQDGLQILTAEDPRAGLDLIARHRPQIVVCDLMMPHLSGMEVLSRIMEIDPAIDVILLTAHYSTDSAVEAIQKGACDYFNKPISTGRLRERVTQLVAKARSRLQARRLDEQLLRMHCFQGVIGRSPMMLEAFARVERIAPHYRTALITGPTGSGKELMARALHGLSPVADGPFIACNCAAIPDQLVESELFGHVKGAFTGAVQDSPGLFESAHGGSLLLDEIGEMPLSVQSKLLRVVQYQEVQRVGSSSVRKVNVRLIAATHCNLRAMVAEKQFREDLFFRLGMVEVRLPTLIERREDLPLLIRYFVDQFAHQYSKPLQGLTRRAEIVLTRYPWPGNVRELEGVLGLAAMMADGPLIDVTDLPLHFQSEAPQLEIGGDDELNLTLEEIEIHHARRIVDFVGGDKLRAARILGVSRATLYRLLAKKPKKDRALG